MPAFYTARVWIKDVLNDHSSFFRWSETFCTMTARVCRDAEGIPYGRQERRSAETLLRRERAPGGPTAQVPARGSTRPHEGRQRERPRRTRHRANDITTFHRKRERCASAKRVCVTCNFFRFGFWPGKDHDIIRRQRDYDVQKTVCISTPKYLRVWQRALFVWKWGGGTSAGLVRAFLSDALHTYSITRMCFYPIEVCFTHGLWRKKIYLAHTLEWHTWFWQYTL